MSDFVMLLIEKESFFKIYSYYIYRHFNFQSQDGIEISQFFNA